MPIPLAIPLITAGISALPSIFQGVVGARQLKEGRAGLKNLKRPEYNIPTGVENALAIAQQQYADPYMPGENIMRNRAAMSSANAVRASQEGGNPLATITGIQAQENRAMQNIGIASAEQQNRDAASLRDMLGVYAKYQDQRWQMNEFAPYSQKYNEFREQVGAGQENIYGALDKIAAIGSTFLNASLGNGLSFGGAAADRSSAAAGGNTSGTIANTFATGMKAVSQQFPNMMDPFIAGQFAKMFNR